MNATFPAWMEFDRRDGGYAELELTIELEGSCNRDGGIDDPPTLTLLEVRDEEGRHRAPTLEELACFEALTDSGRWDDTAADRLMAAWAGDEPDPDTAYEAWRGAA